MKKIILICLMFILCLVSCKEDKKYFVSYLNENGEKIEFEIKKSDDIKETSNVIEYLKYLNKDVNDQTMKFNIKFEINNLKEESNGEIFYKNDYCYLNYIYKSDGVNNKYKYYIDKSFAYEKLIVGDKTTEDKYKFPYYKIQNIKTILDFIQYPKIKDVNDNNIIIEGLGYNFYPSICLYDRKYVTTYTFDRESGRLKESNVDYSFSNRNGNSHVIINYLYSYEKITLDKLGSGELW